MIRRVALRPDMVNPSTTVRRDIALADWELDCADFDAPEPQDLGGRGVLVQAKEA